MKIRSTVLCLPISNLEKTLDFYRSVFGMRDAQIEEGMIVLELPNLSLFLMEREAYLGYARKANREASAPGASAPAIISCAVDTKADVDTALNAAETYGGKRAGQAEIDPLSGGYTGYIADPDGHLWELVHPCV